MKNNDENYFQKHLRAYANVLTGDDSTFIEMRTAAGDLHDLFVKAGGVDALADDAPGTFSAFGLAVSPVAAGRCLLDFMRTRKFARGLRFALHHQLQSTGKKPLNVLYAGSGPYALLAVLMTPYFKPGEVQFSIIDIHSRSVDSVTEIIGQFNLAAYFKEITLGDATKYEAAEDNKPDVLLIETMLNALRKEPQVAVAANLAPQLSAAGIMIPEEITVTPVFTEMYIRNATMLGEDVSNFTQAAFHSLEVVVKLNKASAIAATKNINKPFAPVVLKLEEDFLHPNYELELQTLIKVWGDETLQLSDCSLTLPLKIAKGEDLLGKEEITFSYNNSAAPGFTWKID
jgi:predicted RNA methylase